MLIEAQYEQESDLKFPVPYLKDIPMICLSNGLCGIEIYDNQQQEQSKDRLIKRRFGHNSPFSFSGEVDTDWMDQERSWPMIKRDAKQEWPRAKKESSWIRLRRDSSLWSRL